MLTDATLYEYMKKIKKEIQYVNAKVKNNDTMMTCDTKLFLSKVFFFSICLFIDLKYEYD